MGESEFMKPDIIKKVTIRAVPAAVLIALSAYLLKGDVWTFWTWYLLAMVLGIVTMPLTGRLFREFDDKGSGVLGGNPVFCFFPSVDLSGRISSCGIRNRKIYGLWVYGSHDAKHHSSGS